MIDSGRKLITNLQQHVIRAMKTIEECQPNQAGVRYRAIEAAAGLGLDLEARNGWLTWSILASLAADGSVEAVRKGRRLYWRLGREDR